MKAKQALSLLGVHRRTLCRYVKDGKISAERLPNKTLNYSDDDVYRLAGLENKRMNVVYARVSTYKQKKDLLNQIDSISAYMNYNGVSVDKVYSDIKSGMTLDRKGFNSLLSDLQNNLIDKVYISYKDRLARLSFELAERLIANNNSRLVIVNNADKTDEQELFEDLMQVIHSSSMTMYSRRRLAKKLCKE